MNNYDNFFNNLFPLRPLFPFVQSVLPTVFDDSLSYLETLGKVVKALNDTESNVNTLEQAVRTFANDLVLYGNLTISPVEITFNQETGRYTASMEYADIVSAIEEGHTMVMHVVDDLHDAEYYTATMKITETGNGVKVLYWESPAFTVNDVTVFYEAFINENDIAGVTTRTITGSGSDAFIIHYDTDMETADKTFAEIAAAIEAEKNVILIADQFFISNARWTTSGNDQIGYEIISVQFNAFNVVTAPSGKNLGCVTYAVNDADTWTVTRNGFPNESRVNALIDVKLAQLEGFNSIIILDYNESTGAVTYWDGEQTVNATGQYILNHLIDLASPQLLVLRGIQNHGVGMDTINIYLPAEWGQTTGAWFIDFYRVYDGNMELVRIPYASNIVTKTLTPVSGGDGAFVIPVTSSTSGGVTTYSTTATFADIMSHMPNLIVHYTNTNLYYPLSYTATSDPNSWYQFVFSAQEPNNGELDTEWLYVVCANNTVTVTAASLDIEGLPSVSSADNGKFLRVVNGAWAADTVPSAENSSFGP